MMPEDTSLVAARLVQELGPRAVAHCRMHFVELTAADDRNAADFWRRVMHASQRLLADQAGRRPASSAPSSASVPAQG